MATLLAMSLLLSFTIIVSGLGKSILGVIVFVGLFYCVRSEHGLRFVSLTLRKWAVML